MGNLNISDSASLYLDTSVYIYFFENHPRFGEISEHIFTTIIEREIPLFASELLFTELLVLPMKEKNQELVDIYSSLQGNLPTLQTVPLSREIAFRTAQLKARYKIHTPDAIHLATAIESKAKYFICHDKQLKRVTEIKVVMMGEVEGVGECGV